MTARLRTIALIAAMAFCMPAAVAAQNRSVDSLHRRIEALERRTVELEQRVRVLEARLGVDQSSQGSSQSSMDARRVYEEGQVDDIPTIVTSGPMRYPEMLKAAGIAGRVVVQFVVDTTGRVDANSFKVLSTPHPAFADPAREMVTKSVFRPGRIRGQAVAVWVEQSINFTP